MHVATTVPLLKLAIAPAAPWLAVDLFGASVQVVSLVIAAVCLISAILGQSFSIGPVRVPAPRDLLPRAALAILGLVLLVMAFYTNIFGNSLAQTISDVLRPPASPQYTADFKAFTTLLETPHVPLAALRVDAENVYAEAPNAGARCLIATDIMDVYPKAVDAYPYQTLVDAGKFRAGSADVRGFAPCAPQMLAIAALAEGVKRAVTASAPEVAASLSPLALTRATPRLTIASDVSQESARRVLAAATLPSDRGWIYIGFRDLNSPTLVAGRRVAVTDIPRSGVVATTVDAELLDTHDPAVALGTVKGYVPAGSAVRVFATAGPRHYTAGTWDGYDVYALVSIVSLPSTTTAASPGPPTAIAPDAVGSPAAAALSGTGSPAPQSGCTNLPPPAPDTYAHCGETYPVTFSGHRFRSYRVSDTHRTGIHFRNAGPGPAYLSVFPNCPPSIACRNAIDALVPPASTIDDAGNDYIYTADTPAAFAYGWTMRVSIAPSGAPSPAPAASPA